MKKLLILCLIPLLFFSCQERVDCPGFPTPALGWMFYHHGKKYVYRSNTGDTASFVFESFSKTEPIDCYHGGFSSCKCESEADLTVYFNNQPIHQHLEGAFHEMHFGHFEVGGIYFSFNTKAGTDSISPYLSYYPDTVCQRLTTKDEDTFNGKTYKMVFTVEADTIKCNTKIWKYTFSRSGLHKLWERNPYKEWTREIP